MTPHVASCTPLMDWHRSTRQSLIGFWHGSTNNRGVAKGWYVLAPQEVLRTVLYFCRLPQHAFSWCKGENACSNLQGLGSIL